MEPVEAQAEVRVAAAVEVLAPAAMVEPAREAMLEVVCRRRLAASARPKPRHRSRRSPTGLGSHWPLEARRLYGRVSDSSSLLQFQYLQHARCFRWPSSVSHSIEHGPAKKTLPCSSSLRSPYSVRQSA